MDSVTEQVEYRDIENFPGYRVGNDGSVWSRWRRVSNQTIQGNTWKRLSPSPDSRGRLQVLLCKGGRPYTRKVHRLVLEAFIGPCPEGMEACHDPDRTITNNHLHNLRWDTHKGNCADKKRHGTSQHGERHGMAKLCEKDVLDVRRRLALGESQKAVAVFYGVRPGTIGFIAARKTWSHI